MMCRNRAWQLVTGIFILTNAAGAVLAAAQGEQLHAVGHAILLFVASLYYARRFGRSARPAPALASGPFDDRLANLEQSIDAVAVEIERIGEGQRFMTRTLTERPPKQPRNPADPD